MKQKPHFRRRSAAVLGAVLEKAPFHTTGQILQKRQLGNSASILKAKNGLSKATSRWEGITHKPRLSSHLQRTVFDQKVEEKLVLNVDQGNKAIRTDVISEGDSRPPQLPTNKMLPYLSTKRLTRSSIIRWLRMLVA